MLWKKKPKVESPPETMPEEEKKETEEPKAKGKDVPLDPRAIPPQEKASDYMSME